MNKKLLYIIPALIVVIVVATVAWLYTGTLTTAKSKVFTKVPLPAAIVNNKLLSAKELLARLELAKKVPTG